jgi:hypothetical protein
LLATAHAESVHGLVGALTGSPLHLPAAQTAAFEFVVAMERDEETLSGRRVRGVWRLEPTRDGVGVAELGPETSDANNISQKTATQDPEAPTWFPIRELLHRQDLLADLCNRRIAQLPIGSLSADASASDLEP